MTRDSTFSYVHIDNPNQVLYMERWIDEPIPFDDIDTQALMEATANLFPLILLEDEEDGTLAMSQATFGAKLNKNRRLRDRVWSDLDIFDKFLNEESPLSKQTDKTILKPLYNKPPPNAFDEVMDESGGIDNLEISSSGDRLDLNIATFLANGYGPRHETDILSPGNDSILHLGDISGNSDLLGAANNTFLNLRSHSIGSSQQATSNQLFQTPRIRRTRQPSTDKNYQTPITRIMR